MENVLQLEMVMAKCQSLCILIHTKNLRHILNKLHQIGVLDLTFGEYPYRYIDDEGKASTGGCLYFLPNAWVKKVLDRETILDVCHEVKRDLAHLYRKQKLLSENMWQYRGCYTEPGYSECGDRSKAWDMRDVLKNAYDEYRKLLKDFEEGNY